MADRKLTRNLTDQTRSTARPALIKSRTLLLWGGGAYSISFDAVTEVTHHRDAEVTQFPVEDGFVYTDHVMANPLEVRIRGVVSDQPVNLPQDNLAEGVAGYYGENPEYKDYLSKHPPPKPSLSLPSGRLIRNSIGYGKGRQVVSPIVLLFEGGSPKRIVNVYEQLDRLITEGELLQVQTRYDSFDNMVLRSVDSETSKRLGDGSGFMLELVQITVVEQASISGGARKRKPKRKKDEGKDTAGGDTEDVSEKEASALWFFLKGGILEDVADRAPALPELSNVPGVQGQ